MMSLRIYNPFVELARLENNIREAFEPFSFKYYGFFAPLTDLHENNDGFEIQMNVPGVKSTDLTIDATSDYIEVSTETKQTAENKEKESTEVKEGSEMKTNTYNHFSRKYYRKIYFSSPVDPATGKVSLQDGVLKINIQKSPEAKKISLTIE